MNYMDIWAPKTGDSDLEVTPEEKPSSSIPYIFSESLNTLLRRII